LEFASKKDPKEWKGPEEAQDASSSVAELLPTVDFFDEPSSTPIFFNPETTNSSSLSPPPESSVEVKRE
jgi:hypothetical protein